MPSHHCLSVRVAIRVQRKKLGRSDYSLAPAANTDVSLSKSLALYIKFFSSVCKKHSCVVHRTVWCQVR